MKQDLLELLVDIFKSSGYNVIISSQYDILVEKNGHKAYVMCALSPDYEEIKSFSEKIKGCTGIYVITQKTSGELDDYAAELGIYIWDRDELALQIGRAVLTNMERKSRNCQTESELPSRECQNNVSPTSESARDNWKESFEQEPCSGGGGLVPLQELSGGGTERVSFESRIRPPVQERKPLKRIEDDETQGGLKSMRR